MKKTKLQALEKAHRSYLDIVLYGDPIEKLSQVISKDVMGYGTALDEKAMSFQELFVFIKRQRQQAENIDLQIEERLVFRNVLAGEETAIFVDEFSIKMHLEKDIHQLFMRLSSVFEYQEGQWKMVHLHASIPENQDGSDDTWHINELQRKNEELQQKVAEKTAELQQQNKELEIEAALEKVRSASLAMQESKQLSQVVKVLFDQLSMLDIPSQLVSIALCHPETNEIEYWSADNIQFDHSNSYIVKGKKNYTFRQVWAHWKSQTTKTFSLQDDKKRKFDLYLLKETGFKFLPKHTKKEILSQRVVCFTCAFMKYGYLEAADDKKLPEDQISVLERFAIVFEQCYTRFLDLQKSEAQVKEAQIEAALERVRARTMAMNKSAELMEASKVLFQQLESLGIQAEASWINLVQPEHDTITFWITHENQLADAITVKASDHPNFKAEITAWKSKQAYIQIPIAKKEYLKQVKQDFNLVIKDKVDKGLFHINNIRHQYGFLGLGTWEELSEEVIKVYQRFAKVFEQTYTRFLDLKKAEAQAREAQIEAALERVRAASMAMHKSEELQDVILVVFRQLKALCVFMDVSFIEIFDESPNTNIWVANPLHNYAQLVHIPYFKNPILDRMLEARDKQETFFTELYSKKIKNHFYKKAFKQSDLRLLPKSAQQEILNRKGYARSVALTQRMALAIFNWDNVVYTAAENEILRRFAKVFDQTYTRFLDLAKAEKQAREAQIEAALERVRATSMAMHNTSQLQEVINVVTNQLNLLELNLDGAFISIRAENQGNEMSSWVNIKLNQVRQVTLSYYRGKIYTDLLNFIKHGDGLLAEQHSTKRVRTWYHHLLTKPGWKERPASAKKAFLNSVSNYSRSTWALKNTTLTIIRFSGDPFGEGEHRILERFAKVFEQSYARFLDIRKAEKQAREADIETSLERVRAEAMSMHSSQDLGSVAETIFTELRRLHIQTIRSGIGIINKGSRCVDMWSTTKSKDADSIQVVGDEPLCGHTLLDGIYDYWLKQETFRYILKGRDLKKYYKVVADTNFQLPESVTATIKEDAVHHYICVMYPAGGLYAFCESGFTEEAEKIMQRFANGFHLAYKRFEDLQKAEEQARITKEQNLELAQSYEDLKATQSQLIQAEKMASLGELTAGIAHEIQNPLNFVNKMWRKLIITEAEPVVL